MLKYLGVPKATRYDPAIPVYSARPDTEHDLLISVDVIEHVPEDEVEGVLSDMASLGKNAIRVINTRLAKTILPDGRNAHLTVRPASWWGETLKHHWPETEQIAMTPTFKLLSDLGDHLASGSSNHNLTYLASANAYSL